LGEDFDAASYLSDFTRSLEDQLREALDEEPGALIPVEFHVLFLQAFEPVPRELALMRDAIGQAGHAALERHGLTGPSLRLKLFMIATQSDRYQLERRARGPRPARGLFKKLLEFIDILLESLADALGVGGLVGEFKKCIEKAVPGDFGEIR
jgi:hypothetical protein